MDIFDLFVQEIQSDAETAAKAAAINRAAQEDEEQWRGFKESVELRAAGGEPVEIHRPRLRSARTNDGSYESAETRRDTSLIRHAKKSLSSGTTLQELISSVSESSPETGERLRQLAQVGRI